MGQSWRGRGERSFRLLSKTANMKDENDDREKAMTRVLSLALFAIAAALLGDPQVSNAQSPYSYPWCAVYFGGNDGLGGAMSCYYTSWEQCRTTMLGIGGNCIQSPYYHAQSTQLPRRALVKPHRRRPAAAQG